ncbi:hypothetical protein A0J61_05240 [Choanephora cucurbitarum]|uniref:F-box domain-containing protein n=1 Tax=Choanephora cucurbitarum TaxID=101091 RepID=A0A1C7NCB4_9FUNG|nr:hypothetical protein A0J61_05240 [Choanephora cucurbitarum]
MPRTIPHKVLRRIGAYLSKEEYYQLIFVNHLFYYIYIEFLLHTVKVHTVNQLSQFMNQTKNHRFVEHLEIYSNEMRGSDLKKMRQSLSCLRSVRFNLSSCDSASFEAYFSLRNITSITLDGLPKSIYAVTDLSFPHQLKSLTLQIGSALKVNADLLEHIYAECPILEYLSVGGNYGSMSEAEQSDRYLATNTIKELELKAECGLGDIHIWFTYIGNRFPNLTSLKLKYCSDSFDISQFTNADNKMPGTFYDWFLSGCPILTCIETENILLDQAFFRQWKTQQGVNVASIISNAGTKTVFLEACKLDWTDFLALTKLDICFFYDTVKNGLIATIAKASPNLTQLILRRAKLFQNGTLWIGAILHGFPHLKYLGLVKANLSANPHILEKDNDAWHPLEKVYIEDCNLHEGFFGCVSIRCLELQHVSFIGTRFKYQHYKGHLDLRQQNMHTVDLQCPRISNLNQVIRLFNVRRQTTSEWYYMRKYRTPHGTLMEAAESFEKLNETNTLLLDVMLSQHPSSWEDLVTNAYLHTSDLLEGIHLPKALSAGYFEIKCHSLRALRINHKHIF